MKILRLAFRLLMLCALLGLPAAPAVADFPSPTYLPLVMIPNAAPTLQWAYGGCYASWCERGWYASPASVDVNADGIPDVIASAYSLFALNGADGTLIWRAGDTSKRTWPGVIVADLSRDGTPEIVVGQSGGRVSAYRLDGALLWSKVPNGGDGEIRSLLAADLDGNASGMELVASRAYGSEVNTWVLESNGATRAGWPQTSGSDGYAWGVYNANAAAADLTGDARLEIIVPSDVHYINAYHPDGSKLPANPILFGSKTWGQVGVWESSATEQRGWGRCDGVRAESYRANFADGPAVISDVNGDGVREVITTGNMYDCDAGYPPSRYIAPFIFNADRTRFAAAPFDWRSIPVDTGAPLAEDYNRIESAQQNPVVADLDGDGIQEILFASYDGRVHAYWLDKTEHGDWPLNVASAGVTRFASEPAVVDIENDGRAEVIFATWTQIGSRQYGSLYVVDYLGRVLHKLDLPAPRSASATWNGALAAPTLANVDGDPNLEIILNTAASGVVVYDLPNSAAARLLWATGRGSYTRAGH